MLRFRSSSGWKSAGGFFVSKRKSTKKLLDGSPSNSTTRSLRDDSPPTTFDATMADVSMSGCSKGRLQANDTIK